MAKLNELTVEIKPQLTVDRHTADLCLAIVSEYLNQNGDKCIKMAQREDGGVSYTIADALTDMEKISF